MDGAAPAALGPAGPLLVIENAPASPEYGQALRHVGRTLSVTLVGQGENGARLELPSGQVIVASGSLPFPEQTKLQVRASIQDGAIVLRVLEAMPPAPPALLAPLIYGEAAGLLQRLQAKELPEALIPLANLFASLFASNDAQLQKSVESLPLPIQRLLSDVLGFKDASAAQISHSLADALEPLESLLDAQATTASKHNIVSQPIAVNEQSLNLSMNVLINQLRKVFVQYFEQNTEANSTANMKTIEPLLESVKTAFPSKSTDAANTAPALQKAADAEGPHSNFEKLLYAIKALPNDVRGYLARALSGNTDSDSEAIAKIILSKIEGAAKAPERPPEEEGHAIANQTVTKGPLLTADRPASPSVQPQTVPQKLIQAIEALPAQVRRELSATLLGFAEAEPKAIAEHMVQKPLVASQDKAVVAALEKAPPDAVRIIEQALAEAGQRLPSRLSGQLPDKEAKPYDLGAARVAPNESASNESVQAPRTSANKIVHAPNSELGSSSDGQRTDSNNVVKVSAGAQPPGREVLRPEAGSVLKVSDEEAVLPSASKLAQTLESLPIVIRRALASATLGHADAKPDAIAAFLVHQGAGLELKQGIGSIVESAPPMLRQMLALLTNQPLDAPVRQIAEALGSGGEEVILAAKSLAASAEPTLSKRPVGQDKENAAQKKDGKAGHMFVDRLKYLLRFEGMIEGQNMSRPFPLEDRNSISNWFRSIVDLLITIKAEKNEPAVGERSNVFQSGAAQKSAAQERAAELPAAHGADTTNPEKPPTWQSWLKEAIKALVDPQVSPKEAFFHALATKENVNYFELPLPWAQGKNLEIWVEDGSEENSGHGEKNKNKVRVLLALNFSGIGETRVGLESSSKLLSITIWAERPQSIENELPQMRNELSALGFDANISINGLVSGPDGTVPTIKSQIASHRLHVLG
ncbi:MAG: hypothetical protein LBC63_09675 [Holophagales bacterium]|jgi:hypothetical protein|nr:hypothetical protein [Holophagales bacterium]